MGLIPANQWEVHGSCLVDALDVREPGGHPSHMAIRMHASTGTQKDCGMASGRDLKAAGMDRTLLRKGLDARGPIERIEPNATRDQVRLLVAKPNNALEHASFHQLVDQLDAGDVIVVNDSATLPACLPGSTQTNRGLRLHVSTPVPGRPDRRLVEMRLPDGIGSTPYRDLQAGDNIVELPAGGYASIVQPFDDRSPSRLYEAVFSLPEHLYTYLAKHGEPIRYGYVTHPWDIGDYQTIFARVAGSSEMPSAGRPFSDTLVEKLTKRGVSLVAITLHTGVASLESHEPPYPEEYVVSQDTAGRVSHALSHGYRVVAVGTTVVRALESATVNGVVQPISGFTDLVVKPDRPLQSVTGMITGWHEPDASHLAILEALVGTELIHHAYQEAANSSYLWHEFGDSCLLLKK